jgi:hypothetical protein
MTAVFGVYSMSSICAEQVHAHMNGPRVPKLHVFLIRYELTPSRWMRAGLVSGAAEGCVEEGGLTSTLQQVASSAQ